MTHGKKGKELRSRKEASKKTLSEKEGKEGEKKDRALNSKAKPKNTIKKPVKEFEVDLNKLIKFKFPPTNPSRGQFIKEYHEQQVNYFQISYSNPYVENPNDEQLNQMLEDYFYITDDEDINVQFMVINQIPTKNFLLVQYQNKVTQRGKNYYVVLDYGNDETSLIPYTNSKKFSIQDDDYYMRNYQYTTGKDCAKAEVELGNNFKSFICRQKVDMQEFFIPGVYDIEAETYNGKIVKETIVCVNSDYEKPSDMEPK